MGPLHLVLLHMERIYDQLKAQQQHVVSNARNGIYEQQRTEDQLKAAGDRRRNPTLPRMAGPDRLVELAGGLLQAEQAPHDSDERDRLRRVENRHGAEHDHDHIRPHRDLACIRRPVDDIGHDVGDANEEHDGTQHIGQFPGYRLGRDLTSDADHRKQQGGGKCHQSRPILLPRASVHLNRCHALPPCPAAWAAHPNRLKTVFPIRVF